VTGRFAPRSVRVRLTLWHAGVLAIVLLGYAAGVWSWARHDAIARIDRELAGDFAEIRAVVGIDDQGQFLLPADLEDEEEPGETPLVEIASAAGEPLVRLPRGRAGPLPTGTWRATQGGAVTIALADGTRARVRREVVELGGTPHRLEVGLSLALADAELAQLGLILLLCIPVGVALAAAAGWFLAGRALAPVDRMAEEARRITAERLAERLPVANPDDELGRLAAAFNDMLQRLDRSFEQLRRFTADASHELRTPLTAMRLVGENALRHGRLAPDAREVVGSMLEEIDRLARLVDDLLLLARADAGQCEPAMERCDVAALAREVALELGVLAEEKQLTLRLEASAAAPVRGNALLLRQALQNLVANAIRHGPAGSEVRVAVARVNGCVTAEVADRGPGIPPEHRERIFERFYRVDAARSRAQGSAGLGLAITRWIADAHHGAIDVVATRPEATGEGAGATFRLRLPVDREGVTP